MSSGMEQIQANDARRALDPRGDQIYAVTAIVQDNREETLKVAAYVYDSFQAVDAILHDLQRRNVNGELLYSEDVVKETWALLYCSVQPVDEAFKPIYDDGLLIDHMDGSVVTS